VAKRRKKKKRDKNNLVLLLMVLILFIGFGIIFIKYHLIPKETPSPSPAQPDTTSPGITPPTRKSLASPKAPSSPKIPSKVAIIIDDFGYNLNSTTRGLIELDYPITLAVLPRLSRSSEIALLAELSGKEVILHLPMEPCGYPDSSKNPGPGAIFCNLSEDEIRKRVKENFDSLPQAVGLNNHMGSKATEDQRVISTILEEVKERNLYFVDSLTTKDSCGLKVAQEKGVKSAARSIFLDHKDDPTYINGQFDRLVRLAHKEGSAIAIGHVHSKSILNVLKERLPQLEEKGIKLVFASEVVK